MSLKDILEAEDTIEQAIDEPEQEENTEQPVDDTPEEPVVDEAPKEEEPKKEEKTADDFARERRERVAEAKRIKDAERRAEEAEARAAALEAPETAEQTEIHPDILEIIEDKKFEKAGQEFSQLEEEFKRQAPSDFEEVSTGYKVALYNSIRLDNPRLTHDQLLKETNRKLLIKAGSYYNQGLNPIEEMYHDAKSLGLSYKQPEPKEEVKERKPDMNKVHENQKRSAGMAGAPGRGTASFQPNTAMTIADWSKAISEKRV